MRKISLCYITESGKKYAGEINRHEILGKMADLVQGYPDNNVIATKLLNILPETQQMIINRQILSDNMPVVICIGKNEEVNFIKIHYHHKIIWRTLQKYCDECCK